MRSNETEYCEKEKQSLISSNYLFGQKLLQKGGNNFFILQVGQLKRANCMILNIFKKPRISDFISAEENAPAIRKSHVLAHGVWVRHFGGKCPNQQVCCTFSI